MISKRIAIGCAIALALIVAAPPASADKNASDGRIITVSGTAHTTGGCTLPDDSNTTGQLVAGRAQSHEMTATFTGCLTRHAMGDPQNCQRIFYNVHAMDRDNRSNIDATGDGLFCFGTNRSFPSYSAYRIDGGTGRFQGAFGTGQASAQVDGTPTDFTFYGTIIVPSFQSAREDDAFARRMR